MGFICFSITASAIYVFNDYLDFESDKIHPQKKDRPIASGAISQNTAIVICIALLCSGLFLSFVFLDHSFFYLLLLYVVLNILYSIKLKTLSIVDVVIVSFGFVIRIACGGMLVNVPISHWLYIMTFLLALFIAFAKRRDDVLILNETGEKMRKSINGYNLDFISTVLSFLSSIIVVSYILYVTSPEVLEHYHHKPVYISTLFVLVGIIRYMQLTLVERKSGSPSKILLNDLFIQISILFWILFFVTLIYFI